MAVQPVERTERRLTAILVADVVGYSRLMGGDEEGTLRQLKAVRAELIAPKLREHRGRLVKTTGDGMLAEFPSVVHAVRFATEVQRGMVQRNAETPADQRILWRIGINLADVIIDGDDIHGDGVNVAARLEGLAEPGGICVSRVVRDQVRDKLPYDFDDMGEQSVKNIVRPVRAYAMSAAAVGKTPFVEVRFERPGEPETSSARRRVTPPRSSIVVLPFTNMSADPEQQYFSDGVTENLTTALSRLESSFVISRNTAFTYKDKSVNTREIGRELGVRYVLEGSVQRSGNHVRINAQLIDAESDAHLWADRFEGDTGDLFALQDEITGRLAQALGWALASAEAARSPANPDAQDFIFRGLAAWNKQGEAIGWFERALALDPHSVGAQSWLALALATRAVVNRAAGTVETESDTARAEELISQALAVSPGNIYAHYAKAQLLRQKGRCDEAISEYETVLAYNRNDAIAFALLGQCKLFIGSMEEVIPAVEQAIRLSPRDPQLVYWYLYIGFVHLLQSRTDEAIVWFLKSRNTNSPLPSPIHSWLAAAYGLNGESEHAAAELAETRRLVRDDRFSSIARLRAVGYFGDGYWGVPKIRELFEATYFVGLRKAGVPEE